MVSEPAAPTRGRMCWRELLLHRPNQGPGTGEGASTVGVVTIARSIALFVLAAVAEIGGAWFCLVGVAVIMYAPRS